MHNPIFFSNFATQFFICYGKIIIELKAVVELAPVHKAQVINYLKATDNKIGLLVNFGNTGLEWKRISCFKKND